jgi:mannose-6-phosphate isomerase
MRQLKGAMLHRYVQAQAPLRLQGVVQRYAWGKVGESSRIASFLDRSQAQGPLAEFWLSAHPKGSADVILGEGGSISLPELLDEQGALPFMLKVLSINPQFGLSIQSHPDSETARALHAKDPENYPDPFHKPEIGIALSPVSLLYGFKSLSEIGRVVEQLPELKPLIGEDRLSRLKHSQSGEDKGMLKELFASLIRASSDNVTNFVSSALRRFDGQSDMPAEIALIRRLVSCHGEGDAGLAALCIMNLLTLSPGQAVFIGPNIPHAYLDGDLVECMACSDNVIRAGLTKKYKDSATLIETSSYMSGGSGVVMTERTSSGMLTYKTPAREFAVGVVPRASSNAFVDTVDGFGIVLCLGSAASVRHTESGNTVNLQDGGAVLLLKGSGTYELNPSDADLYCAQSG